MKADEYCDSGIWSYDSHVNGSYINGSWSIISQFNSRRGSIHTRVTRAYAPEALSTGGDCFGKSWAAINYTKLYSPQPDYEVITEAACSMYHVSKGQTIDSSYILAGDALLSMPQDLSLVDPLWSTCTAEPLGGYDPPRVLSSAIALVPGPTTTPDPATQAKPASSPTHSLPIQTPIPEPDAPAEGQPPGDGSGFDPSNSSANPVSKINQPLAPTLESNTGPDPEVQGQEGAPVAANGQQDAGHENPLNSNPHRESDAQDEDSSQIPDPTGQGQQSAPVAAEAQQDGGSESSPSSDSHRESGIQGDGSPAVDTNKADDPQGASIVVGTHTILIGNSGTSFDGVPLDSERSPVTVSGAAAMIQGSSIIVGDAIIHLPTPAANNPTLVAGLTVTPMTGAVAIDGEILHAGDSPRTIAGTLMSLGINNNLALNPTVQALPTPPPPAVGTVIEGHTTKIDGQAFLVLPNGVSIAASILTPGGPAVTISGTSISLDRTALVIDGSTVPISLTSPSLLTTAIGGHVITADPSSVILPGTSLEAGAPGMIIGNVFISLNKAGSLILGSRTVALDGARLTTRIGNELITAAPTGVKIAGSTLLPGAAGWTIDGTKVSLNIMGDVIVGGKTIALDGDGIGIGGLISAGIGSKRVAVSRQTSLSTKGEVAEGRGGRLETGRLWAAAVVLAVVVLA
ncbi:MAG: hypothetical protein Q9175_005718 [Cornicularia normoerica]